MLVQGELVWQSSGFRVPFLEREQEKAQKCSGDRADTGALQVLVKEGKECRHSPTVWREALYTNETTQSLEFGPVTS